MPDPIPETKATPPQNLAPEATALPDAKASPDASASTDSGAAPEADPMPPAAPLDPHPALDVGSTPPSTTLPDPTSKSAAPASPEDTARALKTLWPALFAGAPKPLKLRIQIDIQERQPGRFSKQALSAFFRRHTGSTSYLHSVAHGKARFDLDGQPSGEISEEHRQIAREELARRRGNQDARRALEDQQRRNRAGLLHDYERTTLTRANFCVLKQVDEAELDGLLALAREEAAEARRAAPPALSGTPSRSGPPPHSGPPPRSGPPDRPRGPSRGGHSRGGPPPRGKPTGS